MAASGRDLQMRELMDTVKELKYTIDSLREQLSAKDKTIENLQEQIAYLQKKLFGTSSEKRPLVVEGQLGLFDEVEVEAAKADPEPDAEEETVTFTFTKSRKPKSTKEELLKGIPVKEKVVTLPESERVCSQCGAEMLPVGKKFVRDELHYVPPKLFVVRIFAETYYCILRSPAAAVAV